MKNSNKYRRWSNEELAAEALKYKNRSDFYKKGASAYNTAITRQILDSICSHMEPLLKYWSVDTIKKESLKYQTRSEFHDKSWSAYSAAWKREFWTKYAYI